jgi:hypothetical protein
MKYVIVFRYASNISFIYIVNFDYNKFSHLQVIYGYVFLEWSDSIAYIEIYSRGRAYNETLYIFVVRADADIPIRLDFSRARPRSDIREIRNGTIIVLRPKLLWDPYYEHVFTYTYYVFPALSSPPAGMKYVIVFRHIDVINYVYIHDCSEYNIYGDWTLISYIHNDYVYLPWNSCILDIIILAYPFTYTYNVYIFVVSEDTNVPFSFNESEIVDTILRQQQTTDTSACPGFSLSSKMLLRFISWTATIVLVITALHKFDIYI